MPTPTPPDRDATVAKERVRSRFIQCRLPTDLYEWLRTTAFLAHRTMTSVALQAIVDYRADVEGGRIAPARGRMAVDDETRLYNVRIEGEAYEWLRVTGFHVRTSISALIVAALTRASATQTDETPRP